MTEIAFNTSLNAALNSLPYADGASWNQARVCLPDTRVQLLDDIMNRLTTADSKEGAQIVWLAGVAGAGKSAIAHTIAHRCHDKGQLLSSFFFDQEVSGRNGPQKLFSTIARDLSGLSNGLAEAIGLVLERDRGLASASLSRQFEELILKPCKLHPIDKPLVVVIDALDESLDADPDFELLRILCDSVPKLPGNFCIFITSRLQRDIEVFFRDRASYPLPENQYNRRDQPGGHRHLRTGPIERSREIEKVRRWLAGRAAVEQVHEDGRRVVPLDSYCLVLFVPIIQSGRAA